jgi:hypothetical protein
MNEETRKSFRAKVESEIYIYADFYKDGIESDSNFIQYLIFDISETGLSFKAPKNHSFKKHDLLSLTLKLKTNKIMMGEIVSITDIINEKENENENENGLQKYEKIGLKFIKVTELEKIQSKKSVPDKDFYLVKSSSPQKIEDDIQIIKSSPQLKDKFYVYENVQNIKEQLQVEDLSKIKDFEKIRANPRATFRVARFIEVIELKNNPFKRKDVYPLNDLSIGGFSFLLPNDRNFHLARGDLLDVNLINDNNEKWIRSEAMSVKIMPPKKTKIKVGVRFLVKDKE